MEIRLKDSPYQYTSDYPDGWKFSRGDYFKFPVQCNTNKCFIKRFDKSTDTIAGWVLLNDLNGKNIPNLVRLYDIASQIENFTTVYYVFFEYIDGKTIHELVSKKISFDLAKLTDGLFSALQTLQKKEHWFPDFFEKNMFISKNDFLFLIDLDSAQPLKDLPNTDMWGCKDYWALVFKFYKDILHLTELKPSYFNGVSFNYLHTVFLILRLKIFYLNEDIEYNDFAFFDRLPQYLNRVSPSFQKIFKTVYDKRNQLLNSDEIDEIKKIIHHEIISLVEVDFAGIGNNNVVLPVEVIINNFEVINYADLRAGTFIISTGKEFKLKWDVDNAAEIELYKNGTFLERYGNNKSYVDITEDLFDDQPKKIEYRLVAGRGLSKVEKALIIEIISPITHMAIIDFSVNNYVESNNGVYTVESGRDFTLQWNVTNAQKIQLLQNGEQIEQFTNNENSFTRNEEAWDNKERTIEYTLVVSLSNNFVESVEQASLKVKLIYQQQDIQGFTVKSYLQKNINEYRVENGKPFTLGWDLTQAREMELLKNGKLYKKLTAEENNISITEKLIDDKEQQIIYTLISPATQSSNKSSRSVTVIVQQNTAMAPVIKEFKTNKAIIRNSGFFTLSWIVKNASKVVMYKNGMFYQEFQNDVSSIELKENYEGSVKHLRFSLLVGNNVESIKSETINVEVKPKLNFAKIIAGFLAMVAIIYFILPSINRTNKSTINTAVFKTVLYNDTVTFTGVNIPVNIRDVEVKFNDTKAKILQLTKDSIKVLVPKLKADSNVGIVIYVNQNEFKVAQHLMYIEKQVFISPVYALFTKTNVTQNEVITIKGQNLPTNASNIQFFMNRIVAKIIKQTIDSIQIIVPELKDKYVNITVRMGETDVSIAQDLLYKKSEVPIIETTINSISSRSINEGDIITITGDNIPQKKGNVKVLFNTLPAAIIQHSAKLIKVQVPTMGKEVIKVNISVTANGQLYKAGSNIGYQPQQVIVFLTSQKKIIEGDNLFISGKNLPSNSGAISVLFNNVRAKITDQKSTFIQAVIPSLPQNTKFANILVQVNGKDQIVANNVIYQPLKVVVNVCEMVILSTIIHKKGFLKLGNKNVEFILKNNSKYIIDEVILSASYNQKNGQAQSEELKFNNVAPGASVNQQSKKNIKEGVIKFDVKSITTKDFGLQKCKIKDNIMLAE